MDTKGIYANRRTQKDEIGQCELTSLTYQSQWIDMRCSDEGAVKRFAFKEMITAMRQLICTQIWHFF